jgi:CheY-like chemotaxis protein
MVGTAQGRLCPPYGIAVHLPSLAGLHNFLARDHKQRHSLAVTLGHTQNPWQIRMSLLSSSLVLVVDGDRGILRGMQRLLRRFGYDTLLFPSADAFKRHDDFAGVVCVIVDLDLKDGPGIELGHHLKAAGILVPVIYTTARDDAAARRAALQSGCLALLTKPFSAQSLIEPLKIASAQPI